MLGIFNGKFRRMRKAFEEEQRRDRERRALIERQDRDIHLDMEE